MQVEQTKTGPNPEGRGGFQKGQSGNPGGRAKMPAEVRDMISSNTEKAVNAIINNLGNADPRISLKAAELLLDRGYGKPQQASETLKFDLPAGESLDDLVALHGALLKAVASGDVALGEAKDLSALFDAQRRLVETAELESRIAMLERKAANGNDQAQN